MAASGMPVELLALLAVPVEFVESLALVAFSAFVCTSRVQITTAVEVTNKEADRRSVTTLLQALLRCLLRLGRTNPARPPLSAHGKPPACPFCCRHLRSPSTMLMPDTCSLIRWARSEPERTFVPGFLCRPECTREPRHPYPTFREGGPTSPGPL